MNNKTSYNIDQLSGATTYYRAKVNGTLVGRQYLSESEAISNAKGLCKEGDVITSVLVTSNGQEILLG